MEEEKKSETAADLQRQREARVEELLARYGGNNVGYLKDRGTNKVSLVLVDGTTIPILDGDPGFPILGHRFSDLILQKISTGLEVEAIKRGFREENYQRVVELQARLAALSDSGKSESRFGPFDLRVYAWGVQTHPNYYTSGREWIRRSHAIKLPCLDRGEMEEEFGWEEEQIKKLEHKVWQLIEALTAKKKAAWERFWELVKPGIVVHVTGNEDWVTETERYLREKPDDLFRTITLGGAEIEFLDGKDAQEAFKLALESGAYLPWHHKLGEEWRDLAKREGWPYKLSKAAEQILTGNSKPVWTEDVTADRHHMFGKGIGALYTKRILVPTCAGMDCLSVRHVELLGDMAAKLGVDFAESKQELMKMVREFMNRYD